LQLIFSLLFGSARYGFNEASASFRAVTLTLLTGLQTTRNFQLKNTLNKAKGTDKDMILASVQDTGNTNNADFTVPPDGEPGLMRLYLWDGELNPAPRGSSRN
jgi:hypothetical protein